MQTPLVHPTSGKPETPDTDVVPPGRVPPRRATPQAQGKESHEFVHTVSVANQL